MVNSKLTNLSKYLPSDVWEKIERFLFGINQSTPDAYYPIDGDRVFARVMSYSVRNKEDCKIEAHNRYVDIQSTIIGAEGIDIFERKCLDVIESYKSEDDVMFFADPGKLPYVSVVNNPGYFTMLFPEEAHRPMLKTEIHNTDEPIKKFVIKVEATIL